VQRFGLHSEWVHSQDYDQLERELAEAQHDLERAVANHAADLSAASATAAMWAGKGPDGAGPVKRSVAAFGDTLRGMRLSDWEHDRIMEFVIEQYRVIEKLDRRRPDKTASDKGQG
jgi:hypothetical protein